VPQYIREDEADIQVTLNGTPYPAGGGSWKEIEGGNLEADDAKTRPGGMGYEVAVGGPASRGDLTVKTQMTDITAGWVHAFEEAVGCGEVSVQANFMRCNRTLMDNPKRNVQRKGVLKAVNVPDMGGGNDVALLEIVVSCDELGNAE
jgi:hypothetical protein